MSGRPIVPNRLTYFEFRQALYNAGTENETNKQRRQGRICASERQVLKHVERGEILD
jgi:hypothetical protein